MEALQRQAAWRQQQQGLAAHQAVETTALQQQLGAQMAAELARGVDEASLRYGYNGQLHLLQQRHATQYAHMQQQVRARAPTIRLVVYFSHAVFFFDSLLPLVFHLHSLLYRRLP